MPYNSDNTADWVTRDRARVLVIDDDPQYRSLLTFALRKHYLVSVACDGHSGLEKAKEHPPDVAIVDVQMPGLDGLQTLAAIRMDPALSGMWVIMLTADASRETVLAAVRAGAHDYLIKTAFSKDDVIRKIERLLQREKSEAKPFSHVSSTAQCVTADVCATTSVPGPHHASSTRGLVTAPGTCLASDSESGEILTASLTDDSVTDRPSVDQTHLQEILDSWD
jgi:DNA-binding response OmpR family regulator